MKARDLILIGNIYKNIVYPLGRKAINAIQNKDDKKEDKK